MSIQQLAQLQHTFQDCVIHPDKPVATTWVGANGRAEPETQLSIYTYAYGARLREVLANDYPAVQIGIGEDQFGWLADAYIRVHPSHYFSLRDFGRHLPGFIAELIQQDKRYHDMRWLYEMALFEWTLGYAFDAADAGILSEQDVVAVPFEGWPDLKFVFHPSVQRLNLEWNIPEMWLALTAEEPAQVTARQDSASPWLIWREQLITRFRSMRADEAQALDMLRAGENFNEVCEVLATRMNEEDVPLHAAGLLKAWITQGLLSGIR